MKNCRSCKKEIDADASKCPYCQTFQVWYKNPQVHGLAVSLVFMLPFFYMTGIFGYPKYEDYKDKIKYEIQSESHVQGKYVVNYKIINESDVVWNDISYSVISYDKDGAVVISEPNYEYRWLLPANGSVILSAKVSKDEKIARRELIITSLKRDRF